MQLGMAREFGPNIIAPFNKPLLKWVGNKQRVAHEIASYFSEGFATYFEPFLGSGGVLGTLAPHEGVGSDTFEPLIQIWQTLRESPRTLKLWYEQRWHALMEGEKVEEYEKIKASYNSEPNGADLLFLSRSCYGGIVRFRQVDGYMSTPCGVHRPISPNTFAQRVDEWHWRTAGTNYYLMDYEEAMSWAKPGDLIYCDPPYSHSQSILYGAQSFSLEHLLAIIERCKSRGVDVALSIDGTKRSGDLVCDLPLPDGLFHREVFINLGRSMLKRFQMQGRSLEREIVADRLLLTF
jgi:DNA adenine methylase